MNGGPDTSSIAAGKLGEGTARHVVLVHGTRFISRRTKWTRSDQPMTHSIEAAVEGSTIHVHEWGGANTYKARARGAQRLSELLNQLNGPVAIVAHSHGGNVSRGALSLVDRDPEEHLLVALGTPFIVVEDRPSGLDLLSFGIAGIAILAAAVLLVAHEALDIGLWGWFVALAWVCIAVAVGLFVFYGYSLWSLWRAGILPQRKQIPGVLQSSENTAETVVFATTSDEAGLTLAVSEVLGLLSRLAGELHATISHLFYRFLVALFAAATLGLMLGGGAWLVGAYRTGRFDEGELDQTARDAVGTYEALVDGLRGFWAESGVDATQAPEWMLFAGLALAIALVLLICVSVFCLPALFFLFFRSIHLLFTGFDGLAFRELTVRVSALAPGAQRAHLVRTESTTFLRHSSLTMDPETCAAVAKEVADHFRRVSALSKGG